MEGLGIKGTDRWISLKPEEDTACSVRLEGRWIVAMSEYREG